MKKLLSLFLVLSMLISTLGGITVFAAGEGELTVTVGEITNNTVEVKVFITENPGVAGIDFALDYDADKVTLVSGSAKGKYILGEDDVYFAGATVGTPDGQVTYVWSQSSNVSAVSNTSPILIAKFTLNDGFDATTFSISSASKFADENKNYVTFTSESATLSLPELADFTFESDTVTYDGEVHNLHATGVADGATVTYSAENLVDAGTYEITATAKKDGYISRKKTATLEILPIPLTLDVDEPNKEYDGTTEFTGNVHIAKKADVLEGDDVALNVITKPVYESKDASDSIKLINGVYELIGADKDNYEIVGDLTGSISKRPLTIKADDVEIYEGNEVPRGPALTYTIVEGSLVTGETLSGYLNYVGHAIPVAGTVAKIEGEEIRHSNPNYEIDVIEGTFSVSEKATQSITVGTLQNATYGDTGVIKLAINDTQAGLGDYTVTSTDEDVATIAHDGTVTIVGAGSTTFKITRAGNDTYKGFSVNVPFVVNKRTLFVALATTTINYGEECPELIYTNFANGDDASALDVEPTIKGIPSLLNAGTYPFTISGGHDSNYDFSYTNGTLTVKKLPLAIGVKTATINYKDAFVPEFVFEGFLTGEDRSVLTTQPSVQAPAILNAGTYPISASGALALNYEISYAPAVTLTVNKLPLTIGVNGALITYGDQFVPEFTFDGFADGENNSVLSVQPQVSGAGTDAGFYQITATGAEALNYEITYAPASRLTISKKAVTVTASTPANVRIGASAPALTYTVSPALVSGDSFTGALELAEAIPSELPQGTLYKDIEILQGTLALNDNYELTYVPATLRVVEKDPQVVTFNNTLTATYGDTGVKLLINDQNSALGGFTITSSNQEVATVDNLGNITVLGAGETTLTVSRAGNADIADFTGEAVLTVNKANLTISISSETITYGTLYSPAEKVSYTGFVNGETKDVLLTPVTVGDGIDFADILDAGTYELTLAGATAENYNISYGENNATLTVAKAPLTISVKGATLVYGDTFVPEFGYAGFVNNENNTVLSVQPSVTGAIPTNAGVYQITASGAEASNYQITYAPASQLIINKRPLTVSANSETIVYGDVVPTFTINYDGFITGESEANLLTPAVATAFPQFTDAGEHTIVLSGATSDNYEISYTSTGKFTVSPKPLAITALEIFDKEYDETTTATINTSTLVFDGVVNNDDVTINLENAVATFASAEVGENIAVTVSNLELAGAKKDNYTLSSTEFATTGTILPEITAADVAANLATQITLPKDATELPAITVPDKFTAAFDLTGVAEGSVITSEGKVLPTETEQTVSLPLTVTKTGRDQTATITVEITVPASTQYVITVTSADTSKVTVTGAGTYLKNQTATLVATVVDTNYAFAGWYNGDKLVSSLATYTFTVSENLDLVAKNMLNVISGGDLGGSSTPSTDSNSSVEINGSSTGVSASVSGTSVVITKIDTTKVDTDNSKELNIDLSEVKGAIDTVKLPIASVKELKNAGVESVTVTFKDSSMTFDAKALEAIEGAGGTRATISAKELKASSLATAQQKAVKDFAGAKVYKFQIAGTKTVSSFNGGEVAVTVPYELADGCNNIKAHFVAKDGTLEEIEAKYSNGLAVIYPKHFSEYVISSVKEEVYENPFTDVAEDDWFFESVKEAYEGGLMKGMTDTEFAPTLSVTRAMFVTVLHRLAGEPVVNFALSFDDVKADEWYTEAIRWAASEKIVLGISDTEFGVNSEITREQMVTILYRYKKATADSSTPTFKDADDISSYALDAVNWAVSEGVMKGNADNTFAPKKNATRAETAAVFTRLK